MDRIKHAVTKEKIKKNISREKENISKLKYIVEISSKG